MCHLKVGSGEKTLHRFEKKPEKTHGSYKSFLRLKKDKDKITPEETPKTASTSHTQQLLTYPIVKTIIFALQNNRINYQ